MEVHIRSNGTKVTDGMREFIERRMSKLDRIAEHVIDAHLELRTIETRTGAELTTAQLTLHTGRHVLRAEERDSEPARAIDAAIDKLITRVRRFNDKKIRGRKRGRIGADGMDTTVSPIPVGNPVDETTESEEDEGGVVVRTKRFAMKPMAVEEAIDQMELVGHDFFLFRNVEENELNLLYRRRDGTLGLLAPL